MASFFEGACNVDFSGNTSFTSANTVINNFNYPEGVSSSRGDGQWFILSGGRGRFRLIEMCDINMLQEISSAIVHVPVKSRMLKSTNPFRGRLESRRATVKIRRRVQSAEIVQFGDQRFTVVSFEPEGEGDAERVRTVLQPFLEIALSPRLAWLPQLFGMGRLTTPTLIYLDELVNGEDILRQYWKTRIVYFYLFHRHAATVCALQRDRTLQKLSLPLLGEPKDWTYNRRTRTWQYDVTYTTLSYAEDDSEVDLVFDYVLPLPNHCDPPLDCVEIIRIVPNFVELLSALGSLMRVEHLKDFVRHGVLTFGAVIDRTKPGILWHLPSIQSPQWYYHPVDSDIDVSFESQSVPSLVKLIFLNTANVQTLKLNTHFSLHLPSEDRQRLRSAYLIQSQPFYRDAATWKDLVFVDELAFSLAGTFTSHPSSCHPPRYLHVPPLSSETINGAPCLRTPPDSLFFYWSFDREGKNRISKEDWPLYEIPELRSQTYIGSNWWSPAHRTVWDYLRFKNYHQSGEELANEWGYPILIRGDPHFPEVEDRSKSKSQRVLSWIEKKIKLKGSSACGDKGKRKEQAHVLKSRVDIVGQASIVEISD
ncbi:hypothetical protein E1B28_010515 [Marasmius oreades]|uniref:Uncharacterized protein n=1 Tax=Marasmius oreades TaxID=181124 RepID=A0A9P7RXE9_9AGAR|nr:uncharacterized protein E1B28_010515 [Marasmius oreades]KAG7091484.1 hypothetical protein E1B28_010515 [Marasmius oreades]